MIQKPTVIILLLVAVGVFIVLTLGMIYPQVTFQDLHYVISRGIR